MYQKNSSSNLGKITLLFMLIGVIFTLAGVSILLNVSHPKIKDLLLTHEMYTLIMTKSYLVENFFEVNVVLTLLYILSTLLITKLLFPQVIFLKKNNLKMLGLLSSFYILLNALLFSFIYIFYISKKLDLEFIGITVLLFLTLFIANKINEISKTSSATSTKKLLLYTVVLALIPFLITENRWDYTFNTLTLLGGVGEITTQGIYEAGYIMGIFTLLIFAIVGSSLTLFIKQKFDLALLVPLTLSLALIAFSQSRSNFQDAHDLSVYSLNDAAGLQSDIKADNQLARIYLLNKDNVKFHFWGRSDQTLTLSNSKIDLTQENFQRLQTYIDKKELMAYTFEAINAQLAITKTEWELNKYRELSMKNIDKNGHVINTIFLLVSLNSLPVTQENRLLLEQLSDEKKYHIGKVVSEHLAKLWISFGDIKRAKHFYTKADFKESFQDLVKEHNFNKGIISGTIKAPNCFSKIGLFKQDKSTKTLRNQRSDFMKIKDIKSLKPDGTFEFTNLVKGEYKLLIYSKQKCKMTERSSISGVKDFIISSQTPVYSDVNITIVAK